MKTIKGKITIRRIQLQRGVGAVLLCMALCGTSACLSDPQQGIKPPEHRGSTPDHGLMNFFKTKPSPLADCKDVRKWLSKEGNALTTDQERPGFKVELQYRPAACQTCMELGNAKFSDTSFLQRFEQLNATELYVIKVFPGKAPSDSSALVLSEGLVADMVEVVGTDTLPCAFMHVEALPGSFPYRSAVIGFARRQDGKGRQVILRDPEGKMGGELKLEFPANGLKNYWAVAADTLIIDRS